MNNEKVVGTKQPTRLRLTPVAAGGLSVGFSFVGGLAASRILFEWLFPALAWLGRPLPATLFASLIAVLGWLLWRRLTNVLAGRESTASATDTAENAWNALIPFLPLALNLIYLVDPAVNLRFSRFLFLASLWLAAVFLARLLVPPSAWRWLAYVMIGAFLLPVYLSTLGRTVGSADTFEFQVVVPQLGIVHPTGYPLYLLLAKPFTWLPLNDVAWRVNLATMVFGLAAICLLYTLGRRLTGRIVPPLLAAIIFGLTPTFWSQSIEAEVYALHALIVAAALLLMREIGDWRLANSGQWPVVSEQDGLLTSGDDSPSSGLRRSTWRPFTFTVLLALVLGLGMTNHLTTVILLPAAALAVVFAWRQGRFRQAPLSFIWSAFVVATAFLLPLSLYAYLPIRWSAVNGETMGLDRFIDWVIGGRFQGALQLDAWLRDGARYEILGRLMLDEWPSSWEVVMPVIGLIYLFFRQWRFALLLVITWLGYAFYALNYYVPDLTVFLIPDYLIMVLVWGVGLVASFALIDRLMPVKGTRLVGLLQALAVLIVVAPALLTAAGQTWQAVDSSQDDGRSRWGRSVLELPFTSGAAILADSDKFPPLYYVQQVEGLRPDLDIKVLPDERAYRAELDGRLAAGQPVYLARFLPGLESVYHLRSFGPLIEVARAPATVLPATVETTELDLGSVQLLGYQLAPSSPFAEGESAVTLFWQATEPVGEVLHVYTRWAGDTFAGSTTGQHPAGNTYPTVAWQVGEVVSDYHALPDPALDAPERLALQVALAPPFTSAEELQWRTITTIDRRTSEPIIMDDPLRMQVGPISLDGLTVIESTGRDKSLVVQLSGYAAAPESLTLAMAPTGSDKENADRLVIDPIVSPDGDQNRFNWADRLDGEWPARSYDLFVGYAGHKASCGWFARRSDYCIVAQVDLSSALLPPGAVNFEDKIAMLSIDIPERTLRAGGELPLTLTWQSIAPMSEDYTVFVQVLDADDRIVGQVDSWPVQGTYPTSQWSTGETVEDPYLISLVEDLPPGQYKLNIGWYLLETLQRLPVVNDDGQAVDDKVTIPGLTVSE